LLQTHKKWLPHHSLSLDATAAAAFHRFSFAFSPSRGGRNGDGTLTLCHRGHGRLQAAVKGISSTALQAFSPETFARKSMYAMRLGEGSKGRGLITLSLHLLRLASDFYWPSAGSK